MKVLDNRKYSWQKKYANCKYAEKLLCKLSELNQQVTRTIDIDMVKKGIYYAKKYHGSQIRQSGEPYYSHPIEVAYMVAEYTALELPKYFRNDMIITSLLHDTLEDTDLSKKLISMVFDEQIARQVVDLTRIKPYGKISSQEVLDLLFQQKKFDVAFIKIFDRIHNLQTISVKSPEKAKKIIKETIEYFIILCAYLEVPAAEQKLITLCYQNFSANQPASRDFGNNSQTLLSTFQNEIIRVRNK